MDRLLWTVSIWAIPAMLAITLHEAAHGYAARALGDDTAARAGRISLNPLRHVDPFGTVLLPALLIFANAGFPFGYAKPVPVDFSRLRHPRRDMILVAAAGPGANLFLALAAGLLYHGIGLVPDSAALWVARNLENAITFNVLLAVFNMLPIPPLDGGRVAVGLLPYRLALPLARLERFGMFIVIGVFMILPQLGIPAGQWLIGRPAGWLLDLVLRATGLT